MEFSMFYAYVEGHGEGCDYTIACNKVLSKLKATTWEAARIEVEEMMREGEFGERDELLDGLKYGQITIIETHRTEPVDVAGWRARALEAAKSRRLNVMEAKERAELERLKAKFKE